MPKLKIIYCNLGRIRAALHNFNVTARDLDCDILTCSEPNKILIKGTQWITDEDTDVGILIRGKTTINASGCGKGYVWINTGQVTVFAVYISPNIDLETFKQIINGLKTEVSKSGPNTIILGDFNSKHRLWGSRKSDKRGQVVVEWAASSLLTIHNDGATPTFRRKNQVSYLDLTLSSSGFSNRIQDWTVRDDLESSSDHEIITVNIADYKHVSNNIGNSLKFKAAHADRFTQLLEAECYKNNHKWLNKPLDFVEAVQFTAEKTFMRRSSCKRMPIHWWSEEVNVARTECIRAKRALTRSRRNGSINFSLEEDYKIKRRTLKQAIEAAKESSWLRLLEDINTDPWGDAYRIVAGKIHPSIPLCEDVQLTQARKLFPSRAAPRWNRIPFSYSRGTTQFTDTEIAIAVAWVKPHKAPGPDGLTGEMIRLAYSAQPEAFADTMRMCLTNGKFPLKWKESVLRLIPKPRRPGQTEATYRPICLLSIFAKVLERLIAKRLKDHMKGRLSNRQYGYTEGVSAGHAIQAVLGDGKETLLENPTFIIVIVSLDIRNAFNTVPWDKILDALSEKDTPSDILRLIKSYFEDRSLLVGSTRMKVTCGVPQGSVLGPILWNVFYDKIISMNIPNTSIRGFADDIALQITGANKELVELNIELALMMVTNEMRRLGLAVAPEKTEAIILSAPRSVQKVTINMQGHRTETGEAMKYLGVWLQRDMRAQTHIDRLAGKAEMRIHTIGRLMKIDGPVLQPARKMYGAVIYSQILYAAPAWYPLVTTNKEREKLVSISRSALIRICSSLPTVSSPALEVIAGEPPILLKLQELCRIDGGMDKATAKWVTEVEWQQEWDSCNQNKATWTRRLIPTLSVWRRRTHGAVDRFLCQLLSGHGEVGAYRKRMGMVQPHICDFCAGEDDPEHVFFKCNEIEEERRHVENVSGRLWTPETAVAIMLESAESWESVARLARTVVTRREGRRGRGRSPY